MNQSKLHSPNIPAKSEPTVVGIGASAGGLAALKTFFAHVPEENGLAFVIVVHLSPEHESHLAELLQPQVKMPVQQVSKTIPIEANQVYVIPPNANLNAIDTHLRLSELEEKRRERAPIDHFFRTLSQAHDGHAIGLVLTGTGSDGTLGLKEIKEKGGLTIAQDPTEAEYDSMPQSAIATGLVDLILPLAEMPEAILRYARTKPRVPVPADGQDLDNPDDRRRLHQIFTQIRARTGRDFSRYKRSTIMRRITRRMQLLQLETLERYLTYLRANPSEVQALADDLLITVTNFFRDPAVFQHLEDEVVPKILEGKGADDEVRAWSVGCATGEEAYSLAMLLLEAAGRMEAPPRLQIFASDLHEGSLAKAREGFYPGDIETEVSPARLRRFFYKEDGGYRIRKEVREMVVFAPHNLLGDPPFSRLDLIACRNLLIYLQRDIQRDVIELFHYALRPEGWLVLGSSETVDAGDLFRLMDKPLCLYRKRNVAGPEPRLPVFPLSRGRLPGQPAKAKAETEAAPIAYGSLHQRLVERYAPPSLLVSPDDRVIHLSEHAGRYLVHPGGEPTMNVFKLVRQELRIELRAVLHAARDKQAGSRSKPVSVRFNGDTGRVVLHARPSLEPEQEGFVLVIFDERAPEEAPPAPDEGADRPDQVRINELEAELDLSRQRLQAIIEEYETSQEEMRATNEELQSANEELRSTMEELETSKEELQSINEELQTVNQENRHKVEQLAQLSGDLHNLLSATNIGTLFLDRDLRILRFTPKLSDLFNIRPVDRGRPLSDLTHRLGYDHLTADAEQILRDLIPLEREIQADGGEWYMTRLLPYRSREDRIEGVVITFVDITARKQAEEALRQSEEEFRALVDASASMVWSTDAEGRVVKDSPSWRAFTGQSFEEWQGWGWLDVIHPDDREITEANWRQAIETSGSLVSEFRVYHAPTGAYRWTSVRVVPLRDDDGAVRGWVGMNIDVTERREAEEALRESEERYRLSLKYSPLTLAWVDEDLRYEWMFNPHPDFDPSAVTGKRDDELASGPGVEALLDLKRRVFERGEQARQEITFERSDGRRTYDITATPLREGDKVQRVITAALDITERKQAEESLRESEARLRLAQDVAGVGIFEWDIQANVNYWSPELEQLYGLPAGGFGGTYEAWAALVHPDDLPQAEQRVQEALESGQFEAEWRAVRPDGDIVWLLARGIVEMDAEGEPLRMIGANVDISARLQAEEALREMNEHLEARVAERTLELAEQNQQLRQLALQLSAAEQRERRRIAKILHDGLQQLLVGAKMQVPFTLTEQGSEIVARLENTFDQAIATTRYLSYEISPPTLYSDGLPEAFRWLAEWYESHHRFEVEVEAAPDFPILPEQIKFFLFEAVRELLLNAVKHSGAKSATVTLDRAEADQVLITVLDHGQGFDPIEVNQRSEELRGFGLFSIRERLIALGGSLQIDAEPGAGAKFILTAPDVGATGEPPGSAPAGEPPAARPADLPRGKREQPVRVLIADDHELYRRELAALFEREADIETVGQAADGVEAVEKAAELQPNVVMMDIDMPRLNGFEATRQIKERFPEIVVIGLSIHDLPGQAKKMRRAGAAAFLNKGGDVQLLLNTIRELA